MVFTAFLVRRGSSTLGTIVCENITRHRSWYVPVRWRFCWLPSLGLGNSDDSVKKEWLILLCTWISSRPLLYTLWTPSGNPLFPFSFSLFRVILDRISQQPFPRHCQEEIKLGCFADWKKKKKERKKVLCSLKSNSTLKSIQFLVLNFNGYVFCRESQWCLLSSLSGDWKRNKRKQKRSNNKKKTK